MMQLIYFEIAAVQSRNKSSVYAKINQITI